MKTRIYEIAFAVITVFFIVARFFVPGVQPHVLSWEDSYEAMAHIWVGMLVWAAVREIAYRRILIWTITGIALLELVMFFVDKSHPALSLWMK